MLRLVGYGWLPVSLWMLAATNSGCVVLQSDHDELAKQVRQLENKFVDYENRFAEKEQEADELIAQLRTKVAEAEKILRMNQADLGLKVENLETEAQELRGATENAAFGAKATQQEVQELRTELDARLQNLELKLDEATNIPERKNELLAEADNQLSRRNYQQARRLFRTYQSRYPEDPKLPEIRFKIGLTYYSERDHKSALGEFYRVIQEYPEHSVIPDALYYSGLAFTKIGQCKNAIAYFEALNKTKKTPKDYKQKANQQIERISANRSEICFDENEAGQ